MTTELDVVWISGLPPNARVAMAQQTDDMLTAAVVDHVGVLQIAWVGGHGAWHGPLPVGPPVLAAGSAVALARQTDGTFTAVAIGSGGTLHVAWVDSTGTWQGPVPVGLPVLHPQSGISLAKQDDDMLTAVAVDMYGTMFVASVKAGGDWQGPVPIGGPKMQSAAAVALASQDVDTLSAVAIDPYGTLHVAWVAGSGSWHAPVPVGGAVLDPTSGIALTQQDDDTLTAVAVDRRGTLHVAWTDGGDWHGPVPAGEWERLRPGSQVALAQQSVGTLTAAAIGADGTLHIAWTDGGDWQGPVQVGGSVLDPHTGVALSRQSDETFTAMAMDRNGVPNVAWSSAGGDWHGPVPIHGPAQRIGQLTGDYDPEQLTHLSDSTRVGVGGTDLGFPVEVDERLLLLFGDQFGRADQRNLDPIGVATAQDVEPGGFPLEFLTQRLDPNRFRPVQVVGLPPMEAYDTPTGGFSHDDRLWMFVHRIIRRPKGQDSQILLTSGPGIPAAFEPHYCVTYIQRDPEPAPVPPENVKHDRLNLPSARKINTAGWPDLPEGSHQGLLVYGQAYNPWQAFLGYVPLPLERPEVTDLLRAPPVPVVYYAGQHRLQPQRPKWDPDPYYAQGLFDVPAVSFISVTWVAGLQRWLALYTEASPYEEHRDWRADEHPGELPPWQRPVVCRSAPAPWGPWSDPVPLVHPADAYGRYLHNPAGGPQPMRFDPEDYPLDGFLYAPSVIERFTKYDEHTRTATIYYTVSTSKPYQVQPMRSDLRLANGEELAGELWKTSRPVRSGPVG